MTDTTEKESRLWRWLMSKMPTFVRQHDPIPPRDPENWPSDPASPTPSEGWRGFDPSKPQRIRDKANRPTLPRSRVAIGTDDDPLSW